LETCCGFGTGARLRPGLFTGARRRGSRPPSPDYPSGGRARGRRRLPPRAARASSAGPCRHPGARRGNARPLPFRRHPRGPRLGPAHSGTPPVPPKPFSSSVLGRSQVPATPTKIRTRAPSTRGRPRASARARRPPTPRNPARAASARRCSAIHFRRPQVRQVCCDTLLRGCRPPWPPPCCPDSPTAFLGSLRARPAPYPPVRFIPLRQSCLPKTAHWAPPCARVRSSSRARGPRARGAPLLRSTPRHCRAPAILRDISGGTSYQAVRLVFRPCAQVRGSICTSEPLRASPEVSPGLALPRRSSQPFGSHPRRSPPLRDAPFGASPLPASARGARALLGPCFKTGPCALPPAWLPRRRFHVFSPHSRGAFLPSLAVLLLYRTPTRI
jgi:hypothetical protein